MSDKVELVATAQVNAFAGPPSGIEYKSNVGFKTATRNGPGSYELTLCDKQDARKLVIQVTRNNAAAGVIQATPVGTGDVHRITVTNFDAVAPNAASDTPFFITITRIC